MARPHRCRRICRAPQYDSFGPEGCRNSESILLTLDEYEVLRLVDLEQKTHEQCAAQMDISRSTVTEIYESARRKLAACLVYGRRELSLLRRPGKSPVPSTLPPYKKPTVG